VHMLPQVHAANCQELANTTWALGKANFRHEKLFLELADNALLHLMEFKPQELSNMIWGFGCVGFFHEDFFLGASAALQSKDLTTQHLANILAAVVRAAPRHPVTQTTILNLLPRCCDRVSAFKPQEVSATLLAVAKAFGSSSGQAPRGADLAGVDGRAPPIPHLVHRFFEAAVPWVTPRLPDFSPQSLASIARAFAAVHVAGAQSLVDAISDEVSKRCERGPICTDLHDCLLALSSAEGASPSSGVSEQRAQDMAPSSAQSPTNKKKENSNRRRRRSQLTDGGPSQTYAAWTNSQEGLNSVSESPNAAAARENLNRLLPLADQCRTRGGEVESRVRKLHETDDDADQCRTRGGEMAWVRQLHETDDDAIGSGEVEVDGIATRYGCSAWDSPMQARIGQGVGPHAPACLVGSVDASRDCNDVSQTFWAQGGMRSPECRWNCSVKNSFVHVEFSYDSDSTDDQGACDGGSSQRSSSVPSRLDYAEQAEERQRRYVDKSPSEELAQGQRNPSNLADLNFACQEPELLVQRWQAKRGPSQT